MSLVMEPPAKKPAKVRVALSLPATTRHALLLEAARIDVDMSALADGILEYALGLLTKNKAPDWLKQIVEQVKRPAK